MNAEERKAERIRHYQTYRAIADEKGLSDCRVSRDVGLAQAVLSEWKSGKSQPKIDKLMKLAKYLDSSVEELLA